MKVLSFNRKLTWKRKSRFKIELPCSQEQVDGYYAIRSGEAFGHDQIPTREFLRAIPNMNPYGLIAITDYSGALQGGIELYGLRHRFFFDYISGQYDLPINAQHILSTDDINSERRLYCSITIPNFKLSSGRTDVARIREIRDHLLRATSKVIEVMYFRGPYRQDPLSIYAIGLSIESRALLGGLYFTKISDGRERKDINPLYLLTLQNKDHMEEILESAINPPIRTLRHLTADPHYLVLVIN